MIIRTSDDKVAWGNDYTTESRLGTLLQVNEDIFRAPLEPRQKEI